MGLELVKAITEGPGAMALATVVDVKGSAPRHPGSKMLVSEAGILGTVGGGRGEARALEACRRCMEDGQSALLSVEMVGLDISGTDMVCGGSSTMLIERVLDRAPYRAALQRLQRGERVLFAKRLEGGTVQVSLLEQGEDRPRFDPGTVTFLDPVFPEEKLLILGGGHVARALAALAPGLGFSVTVVDDRPEFVAEGRFPPGVRTVQAAFEPAVAAFPFDAATYAVILTRGHLLDLACVRAVLGRPYRYAGFMGSARKTRLVIEQVLKDGCDPAKVATLCGPIGLDIGGETPEELAVAILAELIAVRRNAPILPSLQLARESRRA